MTSSRPALRSKPIAAATVRPNASWAAVAQWPLQDVHVRMAAAADDFGDQRHKLLAQAGEHAADFGGLRARLVVVEQRVVGDVVVAQRGGFLLFQLDGFFEDRSEAGEVVRLAGFDPELLAEDAQCGRALRRAACGSLVFLS